MWCGNEDKSAFLDFIMKTSNPTLIPHCAKMGAKYMNFTAFCPISEESLVWCLLRAKLSYHCKAQEKHSLPPYMSDPVVAEMRNGWDLNQLKTGNEETIKGTAVWWTGQNDIQFISANEHLTGYPLLVLNENESLFKQNIHYLIFFRC